MRVRLRDIFPSFHLHWFSISASHTLSSFPFWFHRTLFRSWKTYNFTINLIESMWRARAGRQGKEQNVNVKYYTKANNLTDLPSEWCFWWYWNVIAHDFHFVHFGWLVSNQMRLYDEQMRNYIADLYESANHRFPNAEVVSQMVDNNCCLTSFTEIYRQRTST